MRETDNRGFGNFGVQHQRALDLGGAEPVPRDVDDVIHAAGNPVIALLVPAAAVAGEIFAGKRFEISVNKTLVVAGHGAHLSRPRLRDHQVAFAGAVQLPAFVVHHRRAHAEERLCCRTGLERGRTGQRRDQVPAGLGLPPCVDHRAPAAADNFVIPLPRFGVDRFADGAEYAQAAAVCCAHRFVAEAHQRTDDGGGGVENVDPVPVHHPPETRCIGVGRHAFKHQRCRRVCERPVNDV